MTAAPTPPKPPPTTATVRCLELTAQTLPAASRPELALLLLRADLALAATPGALALGTRLEQHQHQRRCLRVGRAIGLQPRRALGLDLERPLGDPLEGLVEVLPALG